jgi:hypothetical protein
MTENTKLARLREIRDALADGRIKPDDAKRQFVTDTDGRTVRLSAPDAMAVLDRRIAAEEAKA